MFSKLKKTFLKVIFILLVIFASGCGQTFDSVSNLWPDNTRIAGRSVQGRPLEYSIHGSGDDTIFILGAIHGDEPISAALAKETQRYLDKNPSILKGKKVIVLPVANPDGLAVGTRVNANGIDLNRNFPAENRINNENFGLYALSQPESAIIKTLIDKFQPNRIISIHQPYNCIDYDGPGEDLAKLMAEHCPMPVKKLGASPGSLGSYAGLELGLPIITFELPESDKISCCGALWSEYSPAILAAIKYPNI